MENHWLKRFNFLKGAVKNSLVYLSYRGMYYSPPAGKKLELNVKFSEKDLIESGLHEIDAICVVCSGNIIYQLKINPVLTTELSEINADFTYSTVEGYLLSDLLETNDE